MDNKALSDILKKAIEMEEKGRDFYMGIVKKVENNAAKKMFEFLAKNELLHIKSIKDFYKGLVEKGEFPETDMSRFEGVRKEGLLIFARDISELEGKIKKSDADKEACEFAMDFENSGYRFYQDMKKKTADEKLIKLLDFLLAEEKVHYEGILSLYTYLTDSANWYMYEEKSFPQG